VEVAVVIVAGLVFLIHGLVLGPRWWRNELSRLAYRPDDVAEWWPYGGALWRGMLRTPVVGWIAIPLGSFGAVLAEFDGVLAGIGGAAAIVACILVFSIVTIVLFNRPKLLVFPWLRDQPGAIAEWRGAEVPLPPPPGTGLRKPLAEDAAPLALPGVDAVHETPVWRDRADFVIGAPIHDAERAEQLWARQVGEQRFEICCIPFFIKDVALGDVVETDAEYDVTRVVERSGRYVFRVWFGESFHPRQKVADELSELGALLEWSSANLLAVDAVDRPHAQVIADYLEAQERADRLRYDTGRS
jgi:hypothetical protein